MLLAIRAALDALPDEGLVLDLRGNTGGFAIIAQMLLGTLNEETAEVQSCRARGPDGVFGAPFVLEAEPDGSIQYAGPVAVITDGITFSAADFFSEAVGSRSGRASTVGAPSGGGFGNGFFGFAGQWQVGFSTLECFDDDDRLLEGAPPPVEVEAGHTEAALRAGEDAVIESAQRALERP
jgi:C-terminal processing protease CtpA/Prc